jgi:ankyrin repeat protein
VSKCRSKSALHKTLSSLPSTLDETYARILDRIEDEDRPRVFRILQFICFGARLIRTEEAAMLWLVGDNMGEPICIDDMPFDSEDIYDFFGGLISIERRDGWRDSTWCFLNGEFRERLTIPQLAHFSVKEYLFSLRAGYWALTKETSHLSIIQYSVAYYLHAVAVNAMSPLPFDTVLEKHSLAEYCCQYMSHHLDYLTPRDHPTLTSLFQLLLHPDSKQLANKLGSFFFILYGKFRHADSIPVPDHHSLALILAARLGLSGVAAWLLTFDTVQQQINTFVSDFDCGPPILEAAARGHTDIISLLLKHGANIDQTGGHEQNALYAASENGQEAAVRMLIEAGACINDPDQPPIFAASEHGHKGIVEMFIKAGADVNTTHPRLGSALYLASHTGHEDVVRTLILAGADVNGFSSSALNIAVLSNQLEVVKLLIDVGADVNLVKPELGTALQAAAPLNCLDGVQMLIRAGANVNLVGGYYGTALQAAAYYNRPEIVEKLILAGADVNLVGGKYGTAMRAVVLSDEFDSKRAIHIVQMLIQAGADVNLKGGKDTSPLEVALGCRRTKIARILRDAGAKPPDDPLHYASRKMRVTQGKRRRSYWKG